MANIHVVLVETSHPGNIGATARAMKNMGLSQLRLVKPKQFPSGEASARASGAADLLHKATVYDSLPEALAPMAMVVGASARQRKDRQNMLTPPKAAERLWHLAQRQPVAIVFGREDSGLTNEELDQCHYLSHIPTSADYSSLNLAQAVQIYAYEIFNHSNQQTPLTRPGLTLASKDALEGLFNHAERALASIDYFDNPNRVKILRRLRQMTYKAQLTPEEVQILRGMLRKLENFAQFHA